jgi:hypothetical protein
LLDGLKAVNCKRVDPHLELIKHAFFPQGGRPSSDDSGTIFLFAR